MNNLFIILKKLNAFYCEDFLLLFCYNIYRRISLPNMLVNTKEIRWSTMAQVRQIDKSKGYKSKSDRVQFFCSFFNNSAQLRVINHQAILRGAKSWLSYGTTGNLISIYGLHFFSFLFFFFAAFGLLLNHL